MELLAETPFKLSATSLQLVEILDIERLYRNFSSRECNHNSRELVIEKRRKQFDSGRKCAAILLSRFGSTNTIVGSANDRSPIWPSGYVGSITHSETLVAVAVARSSDVFSLGIDLEAIVSTDAVNDIENCCLSRAEINLGINSPLDRRLFTTICFSAKEALFKCLYPKVKIFFDFMDAEIFFLDYAELKLGLVLLRDLSNEFRARSILYGNFFWDEGHVYTSFELLDEVKIW